MIKNAAEQFVIDKTIHIEAPQEAVFKLLSDKEQLARWQPMDFFEPRLGGKYQFTKGEKVAFGEIVEFDPPRVVAYTWDRKDAPIGARTVVKYELKKDGDGTLVRLTHTGLVDAERASGHDEGWAYYLARLKTAAEGGDPGPDAM
jgi:uncharacterized protein YndB with AHSA1/START domain